MNALTGFDNWSSVIEAPERKYVGGGRSPYSCSLSISTRIWDNMKKTGFRGVYQVTEIKQDLSRSDDKVVMLFDRLCEYKDRMPLQIKLRTRRGAKKGTSSIDVILQGYAKDPNGFTVIKIDCPDYKTEFHSRKEIEEK